MLLLLPVEKNQKQTVQETVGGQEEEEDCCSLSEKSPPFEGKSLNKYGENKQKESSSVVDDIVSTRSLTTVN